MVLTTEDIERILSERPSRTDLQTAADRSKKLRMHMRGNDLKNFMPLIKGFEEKGLHELRVKYAKSNKDLFARLARPIDKVFSARGGSIYYNLDDNRQKAALEIASNIRGGMSVKKWTQSYWLPHFNDDPDGILLMEVGDGYTYPTYKASSTIYEWLINGDTVEYLIFELSTEEKKAVDLDGRIKAFRVIDDELDMYVKVENKKVIMLDKHTYENPFGHVPAIRNSDFIDPTNDNLRLSIFDDIIELADEFLIKGSVKITHEFLHAYPKYWEYADECDTCKGTKQKGGKKCPDCNGTGRSTMRKVNQVKLLNWPETKDDPTPAPDIGGYIEPSKTYHEIASSALMILEDFMHYTIWQRESTQKTQGSQSTPAEGPKTATEIVEGQTPMHERLHSISDRAEKVMKFIIDHFVEVEVMKGYEGASVNLGRRYVTENPDKIWERYVKARNELSSAALLDELYREFIENKYASDPNGMDIMIKLMQVEPFRHHTIEQVRGFRVPDDILIQKIYFSEWMNETDDLYLLEKDIKVLKGSLAEYAKGKSLIEEPEPKTDDIPQ